MRTFLALLFGTFTVASLHAQLDPSQPEKTSLSTSATAGTYTFSWNSQPNRSYFIQQSEDLASWVYLPITERGDGQTLSYGLSSAATRVFWRLRFSSLATYSDDVDNDGLSDAAELALGRDPLKADAQNTGLPDGWAVAYAGQLSVYPTWIRQTLSAAQTLTTPVFISNDTDQAVGFQIAVTGQQTNTVRTYGSTDSLTGQATYNWTDISATGTKLQAVSSVDDAAEVVTLSQFAFPFFGQNYGTIYVSSNGLLSFGAANTSYSNTPILSAGNSSPIIAGFWDDLDTNISGDIYYLAQSDRLIVQYEQVGFHSGSGTVTFQIVLRANGVIDLFYKTLTGSALSATVGIANSTGTGEGLQSAYNQSYITNGLAVKLSPGPAGSSVGLPIATGTASARSIQRVDLLVQALASKSGGPYNATLSVTFNRSNTPVWFVPVTLKVDAGNPVITLAEPVSARLLD
jgi:hypothetical protein